MSEHAKHHPNYLAVWISLMVLASLSVLATELPAPHSLIETFIYTAAFAKAALVALFFMHLRTERGLILILVVVPLCLFVILLVTLLPDFVFALRPA